ncbi:hypothetical protein [Streptomonospora wellingtoniae]|uniref:ATP/GTP-binding protein n=1 Tax=Streptomonospora wellingtoniae TaxID=3075544 RepID=A0ABU2KWF0_9ACTN|nr:hypothetical protein [Streptomonospora sp. DSM 45055]MDT0303614.1 hypothetical protein [Streptomonospora sp. DSM 45055]
MLRQAGSASLAAAVLVLAASSAARADTPATGDSFLGQIECGSEGGAGCDILLKYLQHDAASSGDDGPAPAQGDAGSQTADQWDSVDWGAVDWDAVDWDSVDWDAIDWESIDYSGGEDAPADPVALIVESMDSFELPRPAISSSPAADDLILVKTPVWLWVDEQEWQPATAEADVPDLGLTLTATPRSTRWTTGDGTEFNCDGPGTPFDPAVHAPDAASPDCGHVYTRSSASQDSGTYTVAAEISWDIEWELSNGESGRLDAVTTRSETELAVEESQGLVTGSGA